MDDVEKPGSDTPQSPSPSPTPKRERTIKILLAIVLTIGVAVALYHIIETTYLNNRFSRFYASSWINLSEASEPAPPANTAEKPQFRVAIAPIVSPEKSLERYQGFVDYVAEKLGRRPVALYRPTYSGINDLVRYERCDIALVCTYPFIRGEKDFGMQALVVPQIKEETSYRSFILVPRSSRATSLLDLRGKRFASADIISTTGWLYPALKLMNWGEDPNQFFGQQIFTGSHDRSVQAVLEAFVDGAAVDGIVFEQMVAEDPSILRKVKILDKSPPFAIPPIVANQHLDHKLKEEVLAILLNMNKDKQGKRILASLQIERFTIPDRNLFAPLRQAIGRLEKWR
jgi:phosphonate transport system substrate-binding protein